MTQLTLQHLNHTQLDQVVALDQRCFGQLWSAEQYQREFDSPNSDLLVLVQTTTQTVLAYGCVWQIVDEAHVTIVAVHPDYRRRGFGQLMMWGIIQSAIQRGLTRATLEVKASNQSAIHLYEQFGFETAGRRKKYYADGEDALILWKNKLQHQTTHIKLKETRRTVYQRFQQQSFDLMVSLDTAESALMGSSPPQET